MAIDCKIWAFCTNFPRSILPTCWKSWIFEKLMQKRACLAVSIAPTALRSEAIATADWSGICKGFFMWQLPLSPTAAPNCHRSRYLYPLPFIRGYQQDYKKEKGQRVPITLPMVPIVCPCRDSCRMLHPLLSHGPWRRCAWLDKPWLSAGSAHRPPCLAACCPMGDCARMPW